MKISGIIHLYFSMFFEVLPVEGLVFCGLMQYLMFILQILLFHPACLCKILLRARLDLLLLQVLFPG